MGGVWGFRALYGATLLIIQSGASIVEFSSGHCRSLSVSDSGHCRSPIALTAMTYLERYYCINAVLFVMLC